MHVFMMFCRAHNYVPLQAREENEKKLCLPVLPCLSQTQYGGSTVIPSDKVLISLCLLSPPAFVVLNFNQQVASWQLTKKQKTKQKTNKTTQRALILLLVMSSGVHTGVHGPPAVLRNVSRRCQAGCDGATG